MNCEFDHCIYNESLLCLLEEIEIDSIGMCDSCIIFSLESEVLQNEKKRQLQELESRR